MALISNLPPRASLTPLHISHRPPQIRFPCPASPAQPPQRCARALGRDCTAFCRRADELRVLSTCAMRPQCVPEQSVSASPTHSYRTPILDWEIMLTP
eukprot:473682-Rhodomonas_salina.1